VKLGQKTQIYQTPKGRHNLSSATPFRLYSSPHRTIVSNPTLNKDDFQYHPEESKQTTETAKATSVPAFISESE
jgi:hypothetical protein